MNPPPRGRRVPRRVLVASQLSAAFLAVLAVLGFSSPAQANDPLNISGPVTDPAGVLGSRTAEVETALNSYADQTGFQLFVVYVPTFDGMDGADWADQTAVKSNIGTADVLLAVATRERSFGISVDDSNPLSDSDIDSLEREYILPELRDSDWAGAAIAAAEGLTDAVQDNDPPWGWIAGGGAAAIGVGAFAVHRIRRRYASTHVVLDEHGKPLDPLSALETDELDQRRGAALVALDNALASSQQELSFAEAQFGKEATKEFTTALATARTLSQQAFAIQQLLDDADPEPTPEHRRMSIDAIHLCEKADALLDEQVDAFNALRDMQAKAPEVLTDMASRADEVSAQLPAARAALDVLRSTHVTTDLASISSNADQAEKLLSQAREQCIQGQQAVKSGDRATAVVRAKAAEAAVGQASTLLSAIHAADEELKAAPGQIDAGIASLTTDVADANRLAANDALVMAGAAVAQQSISYAQSERRDPLAAVAGLRNAEAKLDELLAPARAAAAEAEKARVALQQSLAATTSRVRSVADFIETRRGAVGTDARTRLSEANRLLLQAQQQVATDPKTALAAVTQAQSLADEAERLARVDVDRWERQQSGGSGDSIILGGGGSGWGGSSGGWSRSSSSRTRSSSSRSSRSSSSRRSSSRRSSSGGSRGSRSRGGRF